MGNFYVNMTAKGPDQNQVLSTVTKLGRNAFVLPMINGFTAFCDAQAEIQDRQVIDELARKVSHDLGCPVLCVLNHDDDVLWYGLYEKGEMVDEYDSSPGYLEGQLNPPRGGNATNLCKIMEVTEGKAVAAVEAALRKPHGEKGYIFEIDRHAAVAKAVGLPSCSVGFGYRYTQRGELPAGLRREDVRQS